MGGGIILCGQFNLGKNVIRRQEEAGEEGVVNARRIKVEMQGRISVEVGPRRGNGDVVQRRKQETGGKRL